MTREKAVNCTIPRYNRSEGRRGKPQARPRVTTKYSRIQVAGIETVTMTAEDRERAVEALAVLIAARHDDDRPVPVLSA
jgi:hypothetical protein